MRATSFLAADAWYATLSSIQLKFVGAAFRCTLTFKLNATRCHTHRLLPVELGLILICWIIVYRRLNSFVLFRIVRNGPQRLVSPLEPLALLFFSSSFLYWLSNEVTCIRTAKLSRAKDDLGRGIQRILCEIHTNRLIYWSLMRLHDTVERTRMPLHFPF